MRLWWPAKAFARWRLVSVALSEDDEVAVEVAEPEFAVVCVGIKVNVDLDLRCGLSAAADECVEVIDLEPKCHPVASRVRGIGQPAVVMLDVVAMQLENQHSVDEQSLVLLAAVVAERAKDPLIPAAGGWDVGDRDQWLGAD
jgi:hypothetical protein